MIIDKLEVGSLIKEIGACQLVENILEVEHITGKDSEGTISVIARVIRNVNGNSKLGVKHLVSREQMEYGVYERYYE